MEFTYKDSVILKKYIDESLSEIRKRIEKIERRLDQHIVRVDAVSRYNTDCEYSL